jgi:hypothetical protein
LIVQHPVYRWRAQKWEIRLKDALTHLTQTRVIESSLIVQHPVYRWRAQKWQTKLKDSLTPCHQSKVMYHMYEQQHC